MITTILLTIQMLFTSPADIADQVIEEVPDCIGAACSSNFCCDGCRTLWGVTSCWGCEAGPACEGEVLSCVGCYTGEGNCYFGGATNTCCD